jgi:Phage integrase family
MSMLEAPFGTKIASAPPGVAYSSRNLESLQDLLDALRENPTKHIAMLGTTASRLSEFYNKTCADIPIEAVEADRNDFRHYLRQHRYAPNTVRTYSDFASRLVNLANQLGWTTPPSAIPPEWLPVMPTMGRLKLQPIVQYLIRYGRTPATVCEADLANWIELVVKRGLGLKTAERVTQSLRRVLVDAGSNRLSTKRLRKPRYGIPAHSFPEPLRSEVHEIIRERQSRFVRSRGKSTPIRPVTAKLLQHSFSSLYGFAVNVAGIHGIISVSDLITEDILGRFVEWGLDEREVKSCSIRNTLALIAAALAQSPKHQHVSGSWLKILLDSLPEDSDEDSRRRKEEKYLPYATLVAIPQMMRRDRPAGPKATSQQIAIAVRNELLMMWPTILPWRQLNIRNMRIGGDKPNLFKAPIPKVTSIAKPEWVKEAEKAQPGIAVWQVRFSRDETKTKNEIAAVLPRKLVPFLEDYLANHRPHLVDHTDPCTLFSSHRGGALTKKSITDLVSQFTMRYGGRTVTPHLYRDIFAYMWLELRPEDYLTLSKILWHRNINTTIKIYGQRFNESAALRKMEEVLGL